MSDYSRIPATQDLGLPGAGQQTFGLADLRYDPAALVWVRKAKIRPVEREVVPAATATPRNAPGPLYEFLMRGSRTRLWAVTAADAADAETEFARLCSEYGYRLSDGMTRLVPVGASVAASGVGTGLTNAEVRRRLGL